MSPGALKLLTLGQDKARMHLRAVHQGPAVFVGQPMDFRHTAHIGQDNFSADSMGLLQTQMKSKGGYVITNNVPYVPHIINARALDEVRRK